MKDSDSAEKAKKAYVPNTSDTLVLYCKRLNCSRVRRRAGANETAKLTEGVDLAWSRTYCGRETSVETDAPLENPRIL